MVKSEPDQRGPSHIQYSHGEYSIQSRRNTCHAVEGPTSGDRFILLYLFLFLCYNWQAYKLHHDSRWIWFVSQLGPKNANQRRTPSQDIKA